MVIYIYRCKCYFNYSNSGTTLENLFYSGRVFEKEEILIKVLSKMFGQLVNSSSLEMSVWKVLFSNELIQKYNIRFPSEREFISEVLMLVITIVIMKTL